MTSQGELETSLADITLVSKDGDKVLKNVFYIIGRKEPTSEIEDNDLFVKKYKKNGIKKVSEIDFDLVQKNFDDAKKLISSKYASPTLYTYTIKFKGEKRADTFTIQYTFKG